MLTVMSVVDIRAGGQSAPAADPSRQLTSSARTTSDCTCAELARDRHARGDGNRQHQRREGERGTKGGRRRPDELHRRTGR